MDENSGRVPKDAISGAGPLLRTGLAGYLVATAYNLVRMAKLLGLAKEAPEAKVA